jgi:hypothetical protein
VKVRNPLVAALMILIALGVLAVMVTVGFILFATVIGAGVALTLGAVLRRKFARARKGDLPRETSVRAQLDPSMEVKPDYRRLPAESDETR